MSGFDEFLAGLYWPVRYLVVTDLVYMSAEYFKADPGIQIVAGIGL
jgi:hypothetical protein